MAGIISPKFLQISQHLLNGLQPKYWKGVHTFDACANLTLARVLIKKAAPFLAPPFIYGGFIYF